ncbi:hypothetical protein [Ekhidna sp.]|uniref:hypothetical protein n=1 Tax=Ekhidna sp. TaxID=2608089 RepID=UPI003298C93C
MTKLRYQVALLVILILGSTLTVKAQNVEEQYETLTNQWLEVSVELKSYNGLSKFCQSQEFRGYAVNILSDLHHFDSVMINFLHEPTTELLIGKKEYQKSLKDINNFEAKYSTKGFLDFLRESCITRNDLEKNKEDLKKDIGMNSFDGQVLVLESGLTKYLKHIDKRILAIEKHMHMIHPDRIGLELASNNSFQD